MQDISERVIFYDLETTGLKPTDAIIEIAGKDNKGNIFNKLLNPECEICDFIVNLTGINNKMVKYRNTIEQSKTLINEYFEFDNEMVYLVAHNGDSFDIRFLEKHFNIKCKHIDSLKLFRKLICQNRYSIKYLCEIYKIDCSGHHRALEDVIILEKLFMKAIELYKIKYNKNHVDMREIYEYVYN